MNRIVIRVSILCLALLPGSAIDAADGAAPDPSEPRLFVLHLGEEGFRLEPLILSEGESSSFVIDAESEVVDVIYPVGAGRSGNLVQRSSTRIDWTVRREEGRYVAVTRSSRGRGSERPAVDVAELAAYRIRVNATAADGREAAFVIDRGVEVRRDTEGPVIDMFRGLVPMADRDVSITTEVERPAALPAVVGEAPLVFDEGLLFTTATLPGGATVELIVDFAAGGTVLVESALPPGSEVRPLQSVQYSADADGPIEGRGEMQGAGGAVEGFLGRAALAELTVGDMVFRDVSVGVLSSMPEFGGHAPAGILGVDLLSRADVACVRYASAGGGGHLRLADASHLADRSAREVPFQRVGSHLFLDGVLDDVPVTFVFDTGARRTHIVSAVAAAAGATLRPDDHSEGTRGLDGASIETRLATATDLRLGDARFRDVPLVVADLPVFRSLGVGEHAGLLGNSTLGRFDEIEVDFRRRRIRFVE